MNKEEQKGTNVLIGVTGSVAAIKLQQVIDAIRDIIGEVNVKVVTTQNALHFITPSTLSNIECMLQDKDERDSWKNRNDPVQHIELRKWADVMVVAPLSANTLAKMANGMADNLLTSIIRAWDTSKPLLVAPAMNTYMWDNPHTERHLSLLKLFSVLIVPPKVKTLVCGDFGMGAMAEPKDIAAAVSDAVKN